MWYYTSSILLQQLNCSCQIFDSTFLFFHQALSHARLVTDVDELFGLVWNENGETDLMPFIFLIFHWLSVIAIIYSISMIKSTIKGN